VRRHPGSRRIALCTVTPEGHACCSFSEGAYDYEGGLRGAIRDAEDAATSALPYYCGCHGAQRTNIGIGVLIQHGFDLEFDDDVSPRVIGVVLYTPTLADLQRAKEDREAKSARMRLLVESIASFERGRTFEGSFGERRT
jgi:hypothetical protein